MLALPEGFSYRVVTEAGTTRLKGGEPSPGVHDGAAAFDADGETVEAGQDEITRSHVQRVAVDEREHA